VAEFDLQSSHLLTESMPDMPGLLAAADVNGQGTDRPLSQAWITEDLIADTRRTWSPVYGREISDEEAIEMLTNVKQLVEVLLRAKRGEQTT